MSLTKRWMEAQGLFDDDVFSQLSDDDYEYIKWMERQYPNTNSSSEDCSDAQPNTDPS